MIYATNQYPLIDYPLNVRWFVYFQIRSRDLQKPSCVNVTAGCDFYIAQYRRETVIYRIYLGQPAR